MNDVSLMSWIDAAIGVAIGMGVVTWIAIAIRGTYRKTTGVKKVKNDR